MTVTSGGGVPVCWLRICTLRVPIGALKAKGAKAMEDKSSRPEILFMLFSCLVVNTGNVSILAAGKYSIFRDNSRREY
ncbi:hypothetical protein D3C87_1719290 [compost metagenome]